jgi:hypothetical protein
MKKKQFEKEKINPDQVVLNPIQQRRLAALTGVEEAEISGKSVAQLTDHLRWRIDPQLFFFKKICGRVVKKDPVTGVEYPVPFATVTIEDTDCNLLTYHPPGYPWSWHFPFNCHREIIGTTHTDACGNFCVWVPRFDIDWILHWRKLRFCFPWIFKRPLIKDLIKVKWPPIPNPPDPGPWEELIRISPSVLDTIGGTRGDLLKKEINRMKSSAGMGAIHTDHENILNTRLFDQEMPPPLPKDFQRALSGNKVVASKGASAPDAVLSMIAEHAGADVKELAGFNHQRYIGPFYRCIDFYVPVWQKILDVPDITFRVTQDVNGDGIEETIYSEGYFDVRWNAGTLSNVTLVASSIAKESHYCHTPQIPCGNVPEISFAGMMPLGNPSYFDKVNGYALRINRPRPWPSATALTANTPFCGVVQLHGCVNVQNADYYRILQSQDDTAGSYSAITGLAWNNFLGSTPIPITADAEGWYRVDPINPATSTAVPRASLEFPNLILDWPTPDEKMFLKIELKKGAVPLAPTSAVVAIVSDNTAPAISVTDLSWKYVGESDASLRNLIGNCPMIQRGASPRDIELVFATFVSSRHLRDAGLSTSGCGDGDFFPVADPANNPSHWHTMVTDNTEVLHQRYRLNAGSAPGSYAFKCDANSRSINPAGIHGENLVPPDWFDDQVYVHSHREINVAVVNENLI